MQPSANNTLNVQAINELSAQQNNQSQANAQRHSMNEEQHFLGLANTLQSTLDLRKLLELYDDEVSAFIPHDGFSYKNLNENISIDFGKNDLHSYSYKLVLLKKNLGEVSFYRAKPFTKEELNQLEALIAALLYPVRNSLLYKRAVETAYRDPLTDLNNRAAMDNALDQELDFANRHNLSLSVLMLDLDKFKNINDTYGHIAGDAVLKSLAESMKACVRRSDIIFRYGGEEFLILLRNTQEDGALLLANRIREAVEKMHCPHQNHDIRVTASIGVATQNSAGTKDALLQRADKALYKAKSEGRNRVIIAE